MKALISAIVLIPLFMISSISLAQTETTPMGSNDDRIALLETLPSDKQQLVKDALKVMQEDKQEKIGKVDKIRDELKELYSAKKFDSMAYLGKVNQLKLLHDQMHAIRTRTLVSLATKLSADERTIVMEMLTK